MENCKFLYELVNSKGDRNQKLLENNTDLDVRENGVVFEFYFEEFLKHLNIDCILDFLTIHNNTYALFTQNNCKVLAQNNFKVLVLTVEDCGEIYFNFNKIIR